MTESGEASAAAFRLRASRAAPPGFASDAARRSTYGAALAQFDELLTAARTATSASQPLPLFYALSQAGRAIVASRAEVSWRLRYHGLSCPDLDTDLLAIRVHRSHTPSKSPDVTDSFAGVAAATGSEVFDRPVSIGALWASLPELEALLPDDVKGLWPTPLLVVPDVPDGPLVPWGRVDAAIVGFNGEPGALLEHLHAHFPTARGIYLDRPQGLPHLVTPTDAGYGVQVSWSADEQNIRGHQSALARVAPGAGFEARWLRPAIDGAMLSPLMTWWALLFGLSMLARYEPAGWTAALALDSSSLAAPLQQALQVAVTRLPELVLADLG